MNIFYLDPDPNKCAKSHCDKHVPKMILESAQMLSTAYQVASPDRIVDLGVMPYKAAYKNHPSTKWARQTLSNFKWLHSLALALCSEYTFRYYKIHKSEKLIRAMAKALPSLPNSEFTEPPQCMPDIWKAESTVLAYRTYYFMEKSYFAKWTKGRSAPHWWSSNVIL